MLYIMGVALYVYSAATVRKFVSLNWTFPLHAAFATKAFVVFKLSSDLQNNHNPIYSDVY